MFYCLTTNYNTSLDQGWNVRHGEAKDNPRSCVHVLLMTCTRFVFRVIRPSYIISLIWVRPRCYCNEYC